MTAVVAPQTLSLHHRSPGITALYNELKRTNALRVLDLGSSSGASFNFFSQLSCRIHFEGLDEFLSDHKIESPPGSSITQKLESYLTQFKVEQKFDLVLTWDLFNYMDLSTIEWLMSRLSKHFQPNTLVHCIKYVAAAIPEKPRHFQIINQYEVQAESSDLLGQRKFPCPGTAQLLRSLPAFQTENSYLNYSGMVPGFAEQLLRYLPTQKLGNKKQSSDELADTGKHNSAVTQQNLLPHKSHAFSFLFDSLNDKKDVCVLDLGLRIRNNYDFLYTQSDSLYTENIYHEFLIQSQAGEHPQLKPHMLNFPEGTRFNAILAWDILNFLPEHLRKALFTRLQPYLDQDCFLHTIHYSGKEVPAKPQAFQITEKDKLLVGCTPKQAKNSPLTSSALLKTLSTFHLAHTFVYRSDMQRGIYEYLFRHG